MLKLVKIKLLIIDNVRLLSSIFLISLKKLFLNFIVIKSVAY